MASTIGEVVLRIIGGSPNGGPAGGGPGPSGIGSSGSGADSAAKKHTDLLGNIQKNAAQFAKGMSDQPRWWTRALKTMGIQMGVAGILKQSQIFTSTLGSLFQILGAFVDIIIAPWLPFIIPMLRKLADQIPRMRIMAQKAYDWVMGTAWPWLHAAWQKYMVPVLDVGNKISEILSSLGIVGTAIGALAITWAAAKTARYGLQATRWVPFLKYVTEPIRLLGKGIDKLFGKTASVVTTQIARGMEAIIARLGIGTKPPRTGTPGSPSRSTFRTGSIVPEGDEGAKVQKPKPKSNLLKRNVGETIADFARRLRANALRISQARIFGGPSFAYPSPPEIADRVSTKPKLLRQGFYGRQGLSEVVSNPKNTLQQRFLTKIRDFTDWLKKLKPSKSSMKDLATLAHSKLKILLKMAQGLPGMGGAVKAVGYLGFAARRIIPPLALAFAMGETTYDLVQMYQSDKPWLKDPGNMGAWTADITRLMQPSVQANTVAGVANQALGDALFSWLGIGGDKNKGLTQAQMDENMAKEIERLIKISKADPEQGALTQGKAFNMAARSLGYPLAIGMMSGFGTPASIFGYEAVRMAANEQMGIEGFDAMLQRELSLMWSNLRQNDSQQNMYGGGIQIVLNEDSAAITGLP